MTAELRQTILWYLEIEKENNKLTKEAWAICHKDSTWSGGSYLDAMKKAGNKSFYDIGIESQNQMLRELGVSREYDIEGHDITDRVLEICYKILENQSSTPTAKDVFVPDDPNQHTYILGDSSHGPPDGVKGKYHSSASKASEEDV